ncbi:MAG TPA: hypothetical protein VF592_03695 [Sphingomonas sp.]|jgi:hypothetical protein|uniref:hypothetical protein n=1 Tax=Sphingomonas sp. TaxID=28214 RepID=UPI002EDA7525
MIHPVAETLIAYRWQPYVELIEISGLDLGAAGVTLQVRAYPDAPGEPLIHINRNDNPNAEGIAVAFVEQVDGLSTYTLQLRINETSLEALLPYPGNGLEPGRPLELAYDLVIDAAGLPKSRWMTGTFLLVPGANQA